MKVCYSILFHDKGENLNYKGLATSRTSVSEFLKSQGIQVHEPHVLELTYEPLKRWSNKVILIRHLVEETVLITPELLKSLKFDGIKEAERLLKNRNKKLTPRA